MTEYENELSVVYQPMVDDVKKIIDESRKKLIHL